MKNILVTGGAGFIGSHIVRHHLEKGDKVTVVDNVETGRMENVEPFLQNPAFHFNRADLRNWPKIQEAVDWADYVYHMAAVVGQKQVLANPIDTLSNNIEGCENVLKAMVNSKKKNRLIIASTSGLYIHSSPEADDSYRETAMVSFPPGGCLQETYPISKLVNEVMCLSYLEKHNVDCVMARLFNTIGINQRGRYGMVVPNFIKQALKNEPITVYGDGKQSRSFSNARDTVTALNLLIENPKTKGEIVNVGDDRETCILDLAKLIKKKTNSSSEIVFVPYIEAYGVDFIDVRRRKPNLEKLRKLTGFKPKWTLEQTIDETIDSISVKR